MVVILRPFCLFRFGISQLVGPPGNEAETGEEEQEEEKRWPQQNEARFREMD